MLGNYLLADLEESTSVSERASIRYGSLRTENE